jgi:hypothetical protein
VNLHFHCMHYLFNFESFRLSLSIFLIIIFFSGLSGDNRARGNFMQFFKKKLKKFLLRCVKIFIQLLKKFKIFFQHPSDQYFKETAALFYCLALKIWLFSKPHTLDHSPNIKRLIALQLTSGMLLRPFFQHSPII